MEVLSQKKISIMLNDVASSAGTFDDRLTFYNMTQKSGREKHGNEEGGAVQLRSQWQPIQSL